LSSILCQMRYKCLIRIFDTCRESFSWSICVGTCSFNFSLCTLNWQKNFLISATTSLETLIEIIWLLHLLQISHYFLDYTIWPLFLVILLIFFQIDSRFNQFESWMRAHLSSWFLVLGLFFFLAFNQPSTFKFILIKSLITPIWLFKVSIEFFSSN
jgi:hypothetical protein